MIEMKIRKNFWIILLLLLLLSIFQNYVKDTSVERTIYLIITLIFINLIITITSHNKLYLKRSTKEPRQQVGQLLKESYEIENRKNQPILWANVIDESKITQEKVKQIIAWIPGYGKRIFFKQILLGKRGVFSLGPTQVLVGDPFGMFCKSQTFQSLEKIVILPGYEKLEMFQNPSGSLSGGVARKTRNTEVSPYAISVREYFPGDPLRRIDWKTTARLDRLMVKEFEEDPQATVWILVDGDEGMTYQMEKIEKQNEILPDLWNRKKSENLYRYENSFEQAISFGASICDYYINDNRSVGFCSNSQQIISVAPEGGIRQLDKILELFATLQESSEFSIQDLLLSQSNRFSKGSTVIIISANTSAEFIEAITRAQRRNLSISLISIDPNSFGENIKSENFITEVKNLGVRVIIAKNGQPIQESIANQQFS
jgi:uncharacterized protein (DUF58 family)